MPNVAETSNQPYFIPSGDILVHLPNEVEKNLVPVSLNFVLPGLFQFLYVHGESCCHRQRAGVRWISFHATVFVTSLATILAKVPSSSPHTVIKLVSSHKDGVVAGKFCKAYRTL